ncbi:carboxymuconolactone decarboxylase family protein [Neolewinella agarilytica]|uniref:carboxymuconolactone decarboxylase family protein n=1 Tax=Neolewinella agarilytica TaxID=478744 RepID=UPI002353B6DC|nr:carboxymuconolactone decarboxylase family protein [Neolewinella agarilytica]
MQNFPTRYAELKKSMAQLGKDIPATMGSFGDLHRNSMVTGALSSKHKELIALGIAITVRCDGCITYHVHDALKAGASANEILETIGVAVLMGGGPSMMYGCDAVEALKQFQEARQAA